MKSKISLIITICVILVCIVLVSLIAIPKLFHFNLFSTNNTTKDEYIDINKELKTCKLYQII